MSDMRHDMTANSREQLELSPGGWWSLVCEHEGGYARELRCSARETEKTCPDCGMRWQLAWEDVPALIATRMEDTNE